MIDGNGARCANASFSFYPLLSCGSSMGKSIRRLACVSVGLPLACLAVAFLAPTPARAGCDYTTNAAQSPVDPFAAPHGAANILKHDTRQPSKPCPCNGPGCSRQPFAPLPPPSIRTLTTPEWGQLILRLPLVPSLSEAYLSEDSPLLPFGCACSIFHPPRPIS